MNRYHTNKVYLSTGSSIFSSLVALIIMSIFIVCPDQVFCANEVPLESLPETQKQTISNKHIVINPWPLIKRCLTPDLLERQTYQKAIPCLLEVVDSRTEEPQFEFLLNKPKAIKLAKEFIEANNKLMQLIPVTCKPKECIYPDEHKLEFEKVRLLIDMIANFDFNWQAPPGDYPPFLFYLPKLPPDSPNHFIDSPGVSDTNHPE
ncbi:MAG: hypothetical protein HQL56_08850 [Magnetococcales bacterium]|nr:hypothetical protein [Magnetococcales bacterium]